MTVKRVNKYLPLALLIAICCLVTRAHAFGWYVVDPQPKPNRYVGQVMTFWNDGHITIGTGALIGPRHVLTAAHTVCDFYNHNRYPTMIMFTPGLNGGPAPFGSANVTKFVVHNLFKIGADNTYDFAILHLNKDLGSRTLGWFHLQKWLPNQVYDVHVNGYVGSYGTGANQGSWQLQAYGRISPWKWRGDIVFGTSDFPPYGGASGAPCWYKDGNDYRLVGIFCGGTFWGDAYGVRMVPGAVDEIIGWVNSNP